MKLLISIENNERKFAIDTEKGLDISIPLIFNGPQPNAYGVEPATSTACEAGDLVGDTRRGGSCNFESYTLIPHCSGTHTECIGHITHERISVRDCLQDVFIPAVLTSVEPEAGDEPIITREVLEKALTPSSLVGPAADHAEARASRSAAIAQIDALIVRTLPNDHSKLTRKYLDDIPPYFSTDAMEYIVELGVRHLLVDLPSIDRIFDEGKLLNHRIFWNVEAGSFEPNESSRINHTVTELIYVPNGVEDGEYLLNLQIAPFATDAAPSRPVIFKLFN